MEIRSLCICDHTLGEFTDAPVSRIAHEKALPMLSVVQSIRGSYRVSLDGGQEVETGDMGVFVAPRQVVQRIQHLPADDGTMDAHWVFLDVEINRLYRLEDLFSFPLLLPATYNEEIYTLIRQASAQSSLIQKLPSLHRIVEILLMNATAKPHIREEVIRLRSYIENHYMHPIDPEDLSRVLHCSRSAMYRRFHDYFGETPSRYINRIRISRAGFLLTSTDRPIGEIAAAVGIPDVFYFARLFRSITGETAGDYRNHHR